MLLILLLTAVGILGAIAGALLSRQITRIRQLTSLTGGLFLGMATFLILPEAFRSGPWPVVVAFLLAGCLTFAWVERMLHRSLHQGSQEVVVAMPIQTIFSVIAVHNMLDGWNMAIALQVASGNFERAFFIGMGLHKCIGGLAIGTMLRRGSASTRRNVLLAASAEAITLLGVAAERALISQVGQGWTVWFLAATGGSFLFLAFHSLAEAKRGMKLNQTVAFAAVGFAVVAAAALVQPS